MSMPQAYHDEYAENPRYEVINGEEKMLARPVTAHAFISRNIMRIFSTFLRGKRCVVLDEVDVYFDEKNYFIPDIVIVCDRSKIKYDGIHGAPDLVIEILSPATAKRDRTVKKETYEKFGVKEYWLVDPVAKNVEVYHNIDGRFVLDELYHDYADIEWGMLSEKEQAAQKFNVKLSLYDEFSVSVKEIFEDMVI